MTPYGSDTRPLDRPRRLRQALLVMGLVALLWAVLRPGVLEPAGLLGGVLMAGALGLAAVDAVVLLLRRGKGMRD